MFWQKLLLQLLTLQKYWVWHRNSIAYRLAVIMGRIYYGIRYFPFIAYLQRLGYAKDGSIHYGLVAIIGFSFLIEIILANPQLGEVITGFIPSYTQ